MKTDRDDFATVRFVWGQTLGLCRIARGPFIVHYLDRFAACDYRCRCGIAAACSLYHYLGQLVCPGLSFYRQDQQRLKTMCQNHAQIP